MKTISVHRAADIGTTVVVEPCTIVIGESVETAGAKSLAATQMLFTAEADAIADALWESLPQGVIERMLIRLMAARVSTYIGRSGT